MTGPNDPQDPNQPGQPHNEEQPGQVPPQYSPQYSPQYPPQYPPQQPYGQQYPPQQPYGQPYGQPQYPPQGGYPGQQPYPPQASAPAPRTGIWDRLGPRALDRPQPRLGVTLGGVGVGLVVVGVLIWSFTYLLEGLFADISESRGGVPDDSRRFLGALLGLAVVVIGYLLVVRARSGALRTAGVAATALGIPLTIEFFTISFTSGSAINTDAVFWVSVLAYLISYLFVPGARGHSFYLGLALLQTWGYIVDKVDASALNSITTSGVRAVPGFGGASNVSTPDAHATTIGVTSLIIGLVYYAAAYLLDRRERHGVAVPFLVAGAPIVVIGLGALAGDLSQIGTGIVAILIGLAFSAYGAGFQRRFTTWFWAAVAAGGAILVVTKVADTGTSIGIALIVVGLAVVAGGWAAGRLFEETPDIDEGVAAPAATAPRKH